MEIYDQVLRAVAFLCLLGGAVWFLRRRNQAARGGLFRARASRHMAIVERLPLSPQHAIHLVRIGQRTVLIGTSPNGCQVLEAAGELSEALPVAGGGEPCV